MRPLIATGAALAAAALAATPAAAASSAPVPPQVPLTEVVDALPLDEGSPALYVLAVDTSGSMQESGAYPAVAAAITDVVAALEPADRVSVVTFDVAPRQCGPGVFPASDRTEIAACLPPAADGRYTDVGRAFEQVLTVLEATAADVRTVVLISDGAHEPGPGSAYPAAAGDGPAWAALAARARAVPDVSAYSLPLSGAADGAAALGAVFPSPTELRAASPGEVRAALDVPAAAARRAQARSVLAPDAAAGVTVEAPPAPDVGPEPVPWLLTLRSPASHVPWTVRGLVLDAGPGVEVSGLPPEVELTPGGAVAVTATLRATGSAAPVGGPARVRGSLASTWSGALDELGLDVPAEVAADLGDVEPVAAPPAGAVALPRAARWGAAAAGLAVVAAGAAMAWWVLRGRSAGSPG